MMFGGLVVVGAVIIALRLEATEMDQGTAEPPALP